MEQYISLLPEGKKVTCLEDLGVFSVKELKKVLQSYHKKTSGCKADLILRVYALFCCIKDVCCAISADKTPKSDLPPHLWTYEALINNFCHMLPWTSDLREVPSFSFIQLYEYLVIRTKKFKHIALKSTAYKKLKAFQFFHEGFIRKIDICSDETLLF